jgi:hypothetical protein
MEEEETKRASDPSHDPGTPAGNEMASGDSEPGRETTGTNPAGRPTGTATGRFSTGINPEDENPIDPNSPEMPPP